ncbi:unnamed protein product, partial [Meganyctiphanes norvegica]
MNTIVILEAQSVITYHDEKTQREIDCQTGQKLILNNTKSSIITRNTKDLQIVNSENQNITMVSKFDRMVLDKSAVTDLATSFWECQVRSMHRNFFENVLFPNEETLCTPLCKIVDSSVQNVKGLILEGNTL